MQLTIHASSKNVFNILENQIVRSTQEPFCIQNGKYTKYRSRSDFFEMLFDMALYTSNVHTTFDPDGDWYHYPNKEQHCIITSGDKPKYHHTFTIDADLFTYP